MSVGADRISYIGGLDWQYSLQELGRSVEEEGYSLDDDITEEEFDRVRSKLERQLETWFAEREPYLEVESFGIGEHDVTPEEMKDEGKWKYTLTVSQDTDPTVRRQRLETSHQSPAPTTPEEQPEPEVQQTPLRRFIGLMRQKFVDAFTFPNFELAEIDPEKIQRDAEDWLLGSDVTFELTEESPYALIPDERLLFLGGYKRVYEMIRRSPNEDRDTSDRTLPRRKIPVPAT